jgi:phosphatidylinositol glycan class S
MHNKVLSPYSQSLSNIPIPQKVAKLVDNTMNHLEIACQQLQGGNVNKSDLEEGLMHAREAYADSEKAFFDKSMVGQVYFPDEHKVAVYLPLLGPIGVPLVVGLVRELKQMFSAFRA